MLHQLVYVSKALTGERMEEELEDILRRSENNNSRDEISGVLLLRGNLFLQLLEGPAEAVHQTYKRISADPRHQSLAKLVDQPAKTRLYQDWSMAFRSLTDEESHLVNEIIGWGNLITNPYVIEPSQIFDLLHRFRTTTATAK
jgi:Sensors of blue-light using FAD